MASGSENLMVADFFNEDHSSCNVPLVWSLLFLEEFEFVLTMPFCHFGGCDLWTWHFSKDGLYPMKSAYHLLAANHASWSSHTPTFLWKMVLKIDIPPKVKNYWWQPLVDILPTKVKLNARQVYVEYGCPHYGEVGDNFYAFYSCQFALKCWQVWVLECKPTISSFVQWIGGVFESLSLDKLTDFALICWKIWLAWNSLAWNGRLVTLDMAALQAMAFLSSWNGACSQRLASCTPVSHPLELRFHPQP